jgi:hypothetical protein
MQSTNQLDSLSAIKEEKLWDLIDNISMEGKNQYNLNFSSSGRSYSIPVPIEEVEADSDYEDARLVLDNHIAEIDDLISFTGLKKSIKVLKYEFKQNGWYLV